MTITYSTSGKIIFKSVITSLLLIFGLQNTQAQKSSEISPDIKNLLEFYEKQIYFTENKGQWSSDIHYRAEFPLGQALATNEGMLVGTYNPTDVQARFEQGMREEEAHHNLVAFNEPKVKVRGHGWMLKFLNHSPSMSIESKSKHKDVFNYFSSNPAKSKTNTANFQEVWYNNVYEKVDVRYYPSVEGSLEYDMICKPCFDKNNIELQFEGISKITKKADGSLILETSVGDMTLPAPVSYQKINGEKKAVVSQYKVTGNNTIKFEIGNFDAAQTVIIDPIALRWATWINSSSSGDNHGHCIWVDPSDGAIYVVARVVGTTNNITVGAFDESANGNLETIIGKYLEPSNIGGSGTRVWQTYIGGSGDDNPYAMEQGPDGNLYITGYTTSSDFPLLGGTAFSGSSIDNRSQSGNDIYIMKINKEGNSIKAAVVGGNQSDGSFDLRITSSGDIVVGGSTASTNLSTLHPGTGASNTNNGSNDILIFKINQNLSTLSWVKNYGGSGNDQAMIMNLNTANGDIFVGGTTSSSNFPTTNPRQSSLGGTSSGFLQKLKSSGSTAWSSYFSSASGSTASILCMEFNTLKNRLYFGGITSGLNASNVPVSGVYDNSFNSGTNDFFAASMDTNQTFVASTYIGGSSNEVNMMGLNTDLNNDVYIFGYTNSTNFPTTTGALQSTNLGSNDKVFLKLSADLSTLLSSTYYGGAADDYDPVGERGIKFSNCRIYTIVTARSNNIPLTQGALTTSKTSSTSIYEPGLVIWANPSGSYSVAVIDENGCTGVSAAVDVLVNPNPVPVVTADGPTSFCQGNSVTFTSSEAASYLWSPTGETTQSITVAAGGDYSVTVIDANGCSGTSASITVTIITPPTPVVSADGPSTFCEGESVTLVSSSATGNVWSPNGETTQSIMVSTAGSYFVTVTENGCVGVSAPVDVIVNPNPIPVVSPDGPTTFSQGGSVTLTSSPASSYLWSPSGETTQSIIVSDAGSYYVIVFDENGCRGVSSPITVVINNNPTPVISADGPTTFCAGGSVTLTASSASGYLWSNGATTQSITVAASGNYSVTVTDANGCSGVSAPVQVDVTPPIAVIVTASGPTEICEGETVTLTASAPGATSYQWYQNGIAIQGATGPSITVSDFADFHVVVSNQFGCEANSQSILVKVGEIPNAYAGLDEVICPGESVTLTATGGEYFIWSNGATTQSITVSPEEATDYYVSVSNPFCGQVDVDTVNVSVAELPIAAAHASDNTSLGNPVNFTDVSGDNSIVSWHWDFGDGTSSVSQNTHHTYDFEDIFNVILTVENQYGCSASDTVEVEIQQIILIPNIITPNNDGFNDALGVKNNGVDDYGITIFNRWGQIVYEREAREINWDGTTNSGVALEAGTYFYILKVNNPSGSLGSWEQTGFITLVR